MATSKTTKKASGKTSAPKAGAKATAKKKPAASSRRSGGQAHVSQIDAGWFYIGQNGYQTGQVVVVGTPASSVEYYFLYQSGTGSGQAAYTWPSKSNSPVTNKYTYAGTLPPGWTTPAKYQSSLYPVVAQLVTANCTMSAAKARASAAPRSRSTSPKRK